MPCYKSTPGCGVYENRSCNECPYSKPQKDINLLVRPTYVLYCNICGEKLPYNSTNKFCGECVRRLNKILYPEKE